MTVWPSGPRRRPKAPFRKVAGSSPTAVSAKNFGEKQAGPQRRLTAPPSNLQSYGITQPLPSKCPQLMAQSDDTQNLPAAQGRLGKPCMARMEELPVIAPATNMAGLHDAVTSHARQCDTSEKGTSPPRMWKSAPRGARTPDIEVSSPARRPAELWNLEGFAAQLRMAARLEQHRAGMTSTLGAQSSGAWFRSMDLWVMSQTR